MATKLHKVLFASLATFANEFLMAFPPKGPLASFIYGVQVFTVKGLEHFPTRSLDTTDRILTKKRLEQEPAVTPAVRELLGRLQEVVRAWGILLPPFFQDYDRHNTGVPSDKWVCEMGLVLSVNVWL
jgi:hypothetical protein